MLDPTRKHGWFEDIWGNGNEETQGYIIQVRKLVKELWTTDYKPATAIPLARSIADGEDLREHLYAFKRRKVSTSNHCVNALNKYLSTDCINDSLEAPINSLKWWFERRYTEPELSRFAFDTLAIPL
jgi:hypothetical protein